MKKVVLVLAVFVTGVLAVNAQSTSKVYGPKAKNQKVWVNKDNKSQVVNKEKETAFGGTAKNNVVWAKSSDEAQVNQVSAQEKNLPMKKKLAQKNYHRKYNADAQPNQMLEAPAGNLADK